MFKNINKPSAPSSEMVAHIQGVDLSSTIQGTSVPQSGRASTAASASASVSASAASATAPSQPAKRSYLNALAPEYVPGPVKPVGWTEAAQLKTKPRNFKPRVQRSTPVYGPNPFVVDPTGGGYRIKSPDLKKPEVKVGLTQKKKEKRVLSHRSVEKVSKSNIQVWSKKEIKSQQRFESKIKKVHSKRIRNLVKSLRGKGKDQTEIDVLVSAKRAMNSAELFAINKRRIDLILKKRERIQKFQQSIKAAEVNSRLKVFTEKQRKKEYDSNLKSQNEFFNCPQKAYLNSTSKYSDNESFSGEIQFEDELKAAVLERCRRRNSYIFGQPQGKVYPKTLDDCISRRERRQIWS